MKDIFQRELDGEIISTSDPEYPELLNVIFETMKLTAKINNGYHEQDEVRQIFSEIIGKKVDETVLLLPPFYTDFGKNISIGKNVVIQQLCTFFDRGSISIGDGVFIAPKVNLITLNHDFDPSQRSSTIAKPIVIENNVWIGINATILPGVTIGKNAIVGAGSVVTKDVKPNSIVAGNPAIFVKMIDE
jgi:hypothetical protein